MTKKLIDLGTANNPQSGDTLRLGGAKLNDNFNDIYDTFGDTSRLYATGNYKELASPDVSSVNIDGQLTNDVYVAKVGEKIMCPADLVVAILLPSTANTGDEIHIVTERHIDLYHNNAGTWKSFNQHATSKYIYTYDGDNWTRVSLMKSDDYLELDDSDIDGSDVLTIDMLHYSNYYFSGTADIGSINIVNYKHGDTLSLLIENNSADDISLPYHTITDARYIPADTPLSPGIIGEDELAQLTVHFTPVGNLITFTKSWQPYGG